MTVRKRHNLIVTTVIGAAIFAMPLAIAANPWEIEAGQATTFDTFTTPSFRTISFATPFAAPPVVIVLPTNEGGDPSALRIRNVTASGFDVAPVEPTGNDGPHVSMTFDYVAATPGVHVLPTGQSVVVGIHNTSTVQRAGVVGGPSGWDTVSFGATVNPSSAVVATIQTTNSETGGAPGSASVPWITVAMRNAGATSVQMALERAEAAAGTISAEDIGYIAFPDGGAGSFLDDADISTNWSAVETADNIRGWDDGCFVNTYSSTAFASPRVVAAQSRRDGNNGGWVRRCSLSATTIGLTVDEDIASDAERNHTTETAGVIAFSRSFHAVFEGRLAATKTVTIEEDPVNGISGPFAIPGARARYSVDVQSVGKLPIDSDTISFVDVVPADTSLVVNDIAGAGTGPIQFVDGSTTSALTYNFSSLSSTTDDIDFSDNGGASFAYTPTPGADGADPGVTHFRVRPQGSFAGDGAGAAPSFTLEFDVIVD